MKQQIALLIGMVTLGAVLYSQAPYLVKDLPTVMINQLPEATPIPGGAPQTLVVTFKRTGCKVATTTIPLDSSATSRKLTVGVAFQVAAC